MDKGFTLIELLVVIGIVGILMSLSLVAINPAKQFKSAREAKRTADVAVILDSVSQYLIDHKTDSVLPEDNISRYIAHGVYKMRGSSTAQPVQTPNIDLCSLIVPTYTANIPSDPFLETEVPDCNNYDSGYMLTITPQKRVIISAPYSELNPIVVTR